MPPAGRAGPRTASPLPTHAPGLPELPPQLLRGHCVPATRCGPRPRAGRPDSSLCSALSLSPEGAPDREGGSGCLTSSAPWGCLCCQDPGGPKSPRRPLRGCGHLSTLTSQQRRGRAGLCGRPQALSYVSVLGLNWQVALRGGALHGAGRLGDSITRAPLSPAQGGALPCSRCRPAHTPRPPQLLFQVLLPSTPQHALTDPPSVLRSHTIPAPLSRPARTRVSVKLS